MNKNMSINITQIFKLSRDLPGEFFAADRGRYVRIIDEQKVKMADIENYLSMFKVLTIWQT